MAHCAVVIASEAKQSSAREARQLKRQAAAISAFSARLPARSWIASSLRSSQ
jgi:hypothetical protein